MKKIGKYLYGVIVALDQLACAFAGGDIDCTISATIGYFQKHEPSRFWDFMSWVVDGTFYPFDGDGHCRQAYEKDPNEEFKSGFKPLMTIFTLAGCLVIAPIAWIIHLIRY